MLTRLLIAAAATASAFSICDNNKNNKTAAENALALHPAKGVSAQAPTQPQSKILITAKGTMYIANFDGTKFDIPITQNVSGAPTWASFLSPNLVYAVDEFGNTTRLFQVDLAGSKMDELSSAQGSRGLVHLEFTKNKSQLLGASFTEGAIDIFDVSSGGLKFSETIKVSETAKEQEVQTHQSNLEPSGRFVAVNNRKANSIVVFDLKNSFKIVNRIPVDTTCSPRHGAFFPIGATKATHYLLLCEAGNVVLMYSLTYGGDKGIKFVQKQNISTFGADVRTGPAAGELVVAPDNKNVYVSNRLTGEDTDNIAHFRLVVAGDCDPQLEFAGLTSTGGRLPRMFSLSTDGTLLFVGNQEGKLGVVALKRHDDGSLVEQPVASIDNNQFPQGDQAGPAFVQQIA